MYQKTMEIGFRMRLIAFGCSNTYGQGLPDCHIYDKKKRSFVEASNPSEYAWPRKLGNLLKRDVVNRSVCGASNRRIWHEIINFDYQPNDLVICHWSLINRYAVIYKDKEPVNLGVWKGLHPELIPYVNFVTAVNDDYDRMLESTTFIDHANLFLKQRVSSIYNIVFSPSEFDDLPEWVSFKFDIEAAYYNEMFPKALDNSHTGLEGHKMLAKDLYKIILKKGDADANT
jgi:hypothetical protein